MFEEWEAFILHKKYTVNLWLKIFSACHNGHQGFKALMHRPIFFIHGLNISIYAMLSRHIVCFFLIALIVWSNVRCKVSCLFEEEKITYKLNLW